MQRRCFPVLKFVRKMNNPFFPRTILPSACVRLPRLAQTSGMYSRKKMFIYALVKFIKQKTKMSTSGSESEDVDDQRPEQPIFRSTAELHNRGIQLCELGWLSVPSELMHPQKMCSVNQFVHVVDSLTEHIKPHGMELVLVGAGVSIPEHFRWMIYCMHMVSTLIM